MNRSKWMPALLAGGLACTGCAVAQTGGGTPPSPSPVTYDSSKTENSRIAATPTQKRNAGNASNLLRVAPLFRFPNIGTKRKSRAPSWRSRKRPTMNAYASWWGRRKPFRCKQRQTRQRASGDMYPKANPDAERMAPTIRLNSRKSNGRGKP